MNKEFKAGDVVVLREGCLIDLETILAKEKHLFEVVNTWEDNEVILKSKSTSSKIRVYVENIRHATLKEQYLRDGNSIVIDGIGYLVSGDRIVGVESGFETDYFCDDLLAVGDKRPITKVFSSVNARFENKIDVNHYSTTILWERKPKIKLTSDEVVILKNVNEKYKYIARDATDNKGSLKVYEKEPIKVNEYYTSSAPTNNVDWDRLYSFYHLFKDITFESGVHLIADLIKENEK